MKVKGGAHRQQNSNSKKAEMSRVLSGYGQVMDTIPERLLITAMGHPRKKMRKTGNGTRWGYMSTLPALRRWRQENQGFKPTRTSGDPTSSPFPSLHTKRLM